jgi:hypothetical protein
MMDRHLVYPPGYKKKKETDWDADPSLRGYRNLLKNSRSLLKTPVENLSSFKEQT